LSVFLRKIGGVIFTNRAKFCWLIIFVLGVGFFVSAPDTRLLNHWKLLPQPESFTELYFTDHQHLPTNFQDGESQVVKFTVHNVENKTMVYHYAIMSGEGLEGGHQLASGSFTLKNGELKKLDQPVTLVESSNRVAVQVVLTDQNQSIHYWVTKQDAQQ
jgi:hypothetical protein